jgi:hypothetical protein
MDMSELERKTEQLNRRELIKLTLRRTFFAALGGVAAALAFKDRRVYAGTLLNGNHVAISNGGWGCDCTVNNATQCYCNVPPPPK